MGKAAAAVSWGEAFYQAVVQMGCLGRARSVLGLKVPGWLWNDMVSIFNRETKERCGGGIMELLGHEEKKSLCTQLGPAAWLPMAQLHQLPDVISDSKGPNPSSSFPTWYLCLIPSVKPHS